MNKYTVQAQLGNKAGAVIFSAYDDESATIRAIEIILEHATWSNTWAKGSITLRDPAGALLRAMDAKAIGDHECIPLVEGDDTCFSCNKQLTH
jgi:hypothetical protein